VQAIAAGTVRRFEAALLGLAAPVGGAGPGFEEHAKRQRGMRGGQIVAAGTPEEVAEELRSFTGGYLKGMLAKGGASREAAE